MGFGFMSFTASNTDEQANGNGVELRNWLMLAFWLYLITVFIDVQFVGLKPYIPFFNETPWLASLPWQSALLVSLIAQAAGWRTMPRWLQAGALVAGVAAAIGRKMWLPETAAELVLLHFFAPLLCVFVVLMAGDAWRARQQQRPCPQWVRCFLYFWLLIMLLSTALNAMLNALGWLLPATFDPYLYAISGAYGYIETYVVRHFASLPPAFATLALVAYQFLTFYSFLMIALLWRHGRLQQLHGWRVLVVPALLAPFLYAWLPGVGTWFAFGDNGFPFATPSFDADPGVAVFTIAYRNAMPSFHFTGAYLLWMLAIGLRNRFLIWLNFLFFLTTIYTTMPIGDHYFVDLVVAFPMAAFLAVWLIDPAAFPSLGVWARRRFWATGAVFVLWMVLLRLAPAFLSNNWGFVRALSLVSSVLAGWLTVDFIRAVRLLPVEVKTPARPNWEHQPIRLARFLPAELDGRSWLVGIFLVSGFAGLMYEVIYAKALAVTFGATALASYTVLATYMGGMALGTWLGGIVAARSQRPPLQLYAFCELGIGLYAMVTPLLFELVSAVYVRLSLDVPADAPALLVLRVVLGAGVLGLPTILMGATLPFVFRQLKDMGVPTARAIAPLYSANVLGAASGALLTGYVLLPALGRMRATYLAALLGLMVALYVLERLKKDHLLQQKAVAAPAVATQALQVPGRVGRAALLVLLAGGALTLALEVLNMHLLAIVAGNSVYAFGLMLATFLLGLGLGSTLGERLLARFAAVDVVVWAQCALALSIVLTAQLWDGMVVYFASFGVAADAFELSLNFGARELIRAIVCTMAMLPPALAIGMSYPATMALATDWLAERRNPARALGLASGVNTLGNIAGVLLAGFVLLPQLGSNRALFTLAAAALALAALMSWAAMRQTDSLRRMRWMRQYSPLLLGAVALPFFPHSWDYTMLSNGANVYFSASNWGESIAHAESAEGGLTSVSQIELQDGQKIHTLLTNGKFQGSDSTEGEMVAQQALALIPLLHTTQRDEALVIGYGTGTSAATLYHQGFTKMDIAELSHDLVELADRYFARVGERISQAEGVNMHYTDGRNFLLTQNRQYDLISLEISSIWFAGAANLYNREFYELARMRLKDNGVLQQWVQLHHMTPQDFLTILGSVRTTFRYVWLYFYGGQGIIVASNSEQAINNEAAYQMLEQNAVQTMVKIKDLPAGLVLAPPQVERILRRIDPLQRLLVSTDDNLRLEYSTPKGNAITQNTVPIILENLLRLAREDKPQ